jgi:hypothetical protein
MAPAVAATVAIDAHDAAWLAISGRTKEFAVYEEIASVEAAASASAQNALQPASARRKAA